MMFIISTFFYLLMIIYLGIASLVLRNQYSSNDRLSKLLLGLGVSFGVIIILRVWYFKVQSITFSRYTMSVEQYW